MKALARKLAKKWLTKKFGQRCEDYCFGCPCCDKWRAFDMLFTKQESASILEEIDLLEKELEWRKRIYQSSQKDHIATLASMESESIAHIGVEIIVSQNKNLDSVPF